MFLSRAPDFSSDLAITDQSDTLSSWFVGLLHSITTSSHAAICVEFGDRILHSHTFQQFQMQILPSHEEISFTLLIAYALFLHILTQPGFGFLVCSLSAAWRHKRKTHADVRGGTRSRSVTYRIVFIYKVIDHKIDLRLPWRVNTRQELQVILSERNLSVANSNILARSWMLMIRTNRYLPSLSFQLLTYLLTSVFRCLSIRKSCIKVARLSCTWLGFKLAERYSL